jgi:hypothetical protein
MNKLISIFIIIIGAVAVHAVLGFAGVDIGLYLSGLLWIVSLGMFFIMLPGALPTG